MLKMNKKIDKLAEKDFYRYIELMYTITWNKLNVFMTKNCEPFISFIDPQVFDH